MEWLTLKRGAGLSPVTDSTIQFSELPDVLFNSGAPDEVSQFSSSETSAVCESPWPCHTYRT